jgi:coenzyme F420-0:L-glutamate ligase/coenzyme F420-1:gamma-L-glutamate ligase
MIELLLSRRSVRNFKSDPVPDELIRRILEAAHAAPSAHNAQPWRFVVLRDAGQRRTLAERMAEAYARDAEADGRTPEAVRTRNERSINRISGAPAAVLALVDEACLPSQTGRSLPGERLMLVQSAAAALQNLLLAAHSAGLGTCWVCAPLFCPQTVRETLRLPESWVAQAIILIGYPGEASRPAQRRPLDEVVQWR